MVLQLGYSGLHWNVNVDSLCTDNVVIEIEFVATNGTDGGQPHNRT